MTVSLSQTGGPSSGTVSAEMVALGSRVSTLQTQAAVPGPQQTYYQQLAEQASAELFRVCCNTGRLDPAVAISTLSSFFSPAWLAKYAPQIASLTTQLAEAGHAGDLDAQLRAARFQALDLAIAQGIQSGKYSGAQAIMATMS